MSDTIDKPIDLFQSVSIVISPHERGFTCGVIDPKSPTERDVCSYIAKGLIKYATDNPDEVYSLGIRAFYEDDGSSTDTISEDDNVIDILKFLNKKDLN